VLDIPVLTKSEKLGSKAFHPTNQHRAKFFKSASCESLWQVALETRSLCDEGNKRKAHVRSPSVDLELVNVARNKFFPVVFKNKYTIEKSPKV